MRILQLGWEYPPNIAGGLGTACKGVIEALARDHEIDFILPFHHDYLRSRNVSFYSTSHSSNYDEDDFKEHPESYLSQDTLRYFPINSWLRPYDNEEDLVSNVRREIQSTKGPKVFTPLTKVNCSSFRQALDQPLSLEFDAVGQELAHSVYNHNIFREVARFAALASEVHLTHRPDVIHCHDWMTVTAAVEAKKKLSRPLVFHVHSTEYDRARNTSADICKIEQFGAQSADHVITVSKRTRDIMVNHYQIDPRKITVVYNGIDPIQEVVGKPTLKDLPKLKKQVLFLGRITHQKGPEYFLEAAAHVLSKHKDIEFIMAGDGDLRYPMIHRAIELGIHGQVQFPGYVSGAKRASMYRHADLFVLPSVSEPFGLTPFEAACYGLPTIVTEESGIGELLDQQFKYSFSDSRRLADLIIELLSNESARVANYNTMLSQVETFTWSKAGSKISELYERLQA